MIKSATHAILVTFQESQKRKSLSAVVALKDEANGDKKGIF